jgi:hypothetical protein
VLRAEVSRNLVQRVIGLKLREVRHQGEMTPTIAEVRQLVEEVPGGLTGDARKVTLPRGAPFVSMAARAGLHTLFHRVERWAGRIGGMRATERKQRNQKRRHEGAMEWFDHGCMLDYLNVDYS